MLLVSADLSQNVALLKEATHQVMRTEGDGFPLFAVKVVHARDGCAAPPPPSLHRRLHLHRHQQQLPTPGNYPQSSPQAA